MVAGAPLMAPLHDDNLYLVQIDEKKIGVFKIETWKH